jgi:hypothetical protein
MQPLTTPHLPSQLLFPPVFVATSVQPNGKGATAEDAVTPLFTMVGVVGFEPTTPCSQKKLCSFEG